MIENAGYTIIKMERTSPEGAQERGIAIGKAVNPKRPAQWVTWRYTVDDGYDFYNGNYTSVERMAYYDFYRRLMQEYED